jgi:hypothetical protein
VRATKDVGLPSTKSILQLQASSGAAGPSLCVLRPVWPHDAFGRTPSQPTSPSREGLEVIP